MDQRIGVDVIEVVAFWNLRGLGQEQRREIGVFAVEVHDVGDEVSLLQQVATAREIGNPGLRLLCPGFIACEPLAKWSERQAGLAVEQRLMHRCMNYKTVQTIHHFFVGRRLQCCRRPRPCAGRCGH